MPQGSQQLIIVLFVALAVTVAIGAIVGIAVARRRRRELLDRLGAAGWRIDAKPDGAQRESAFGPFEALGLGRGARGVRATMDGEVEGAEVRVIEHRYVEGGGNNSRTVRHVAAAIPCPDSWPMLRLSHEHLGTKLLSMLGGKDLQVESEAFNKRWRIAADDEDFAVLVLSPDVQDWLMRDDRREVWAIGRGWIACARRERLRAESFERISRRPLELLAMLPPELVAYERRSAAV